MLASLCLAFTGAPVYHYIRSNTDGSKPENVVIRMASHREIETFKYVRPGTASAYVVCTMEDDLRAPKTVRSWRLSGKDRKLVAWIDASKEGGFARVQVIPTGEPAESVLLPENGWHIYNMDLGSLMATLRHSERDSVQFNFIEPNFRALTPVMVDIGMVTATRKGWERRDGWRIRRWELTGGPLKSERGSFWISEEGVMVGARLPIPNHEGYRDFAMRLVSVSRMTSGEWGGFIRKTVLGRNPKAS